MSSLQISNLENSVAQVFSLLVDRSPYQQNELADRIGFKSVNMMSMIKSGKTKIPISKISVVAKVLDCNAMELLDLCMSEYQPDNWNVIKSIVRI